MMNRIITISREFGSGGRTIGKQVAEKLGISCYDRELIEKAAEESGFAKEYIETMGEHAMRGGWLAAMLAGRNYYNGMSNQDYIWIVQKKIILELAQKESCVIVGRCADYILKDQADCLRIFIHADMDKRAERIVNLYGEREDSPEKRLKDRDKTRSAYYRFYTDTEWGDARNYDVTFNSSSLGIETCVDIICGLY